MTTDVATGLPRATVRLTRQAQPGLTGL